MLDVVLVDLSAADSRTWEDRLSVHVGLRSILSYIREKGHSGNILFNLSPSIPNQKVLSVFAKEIIEKKPLVLGFSPYQPLEGKSLNNIFQIEKILMKVHSAGVFPYVALGGHFASFNSTKLMKDFPWIDFVVRGEGEETFDELIFGLKNNHDLIKIPGLVFREKGKTIENFPRPLIKNLDKLAIPALDHLDFAKKSNIPRDSLIISSSRGCYGKCAFCSIQSFYHLSTPKKCAWRPRSPKKVVDELELLLKKYNCSAFRFVDDNFIGPKGRGQKRAIAIAKEIIRRGLKIKFRIMCRTNDIEEKTIKELKNAGLTEVAIGVESGCDDALKIYSKGISVAENKKALLLLNKLGITIIPTFIFLGPYSSLKEIKENISFYRFARSLNVNWPNEIMLGDLRVFSGTPLKFLLEKENSLFGNYINGFNYGFGYRYKDKRLSYIRKLSEMFIQTSIFFDRLIAVNHILGKNMDNLYKIKTRICTNSAMEVIEKAVGILESARPKKIKQFVDRIKHKLKKTNTEIQIREKLILLQN